jgi:hypothetical protein
MSFLSCPVLVITFLRSNYVLSVAVRPVYHPQSILSMELYPVCCSGRIRVRSGAEIYVSYPDSDIYVLSFLYSSLHYYVQILRSSIRSVAVAGSGFGTEIYLKYQDISYLLSEAELLDQDAVRVPLPLGLAVQQSPPDVVVALPALRRLHLGPSVINHTLQGYAVHGSG